MFKEAENTSEYQFEDVIVNLLEEVYKLMDEQNIKTSKKLIKKLGKHKKSSVRKFLRGGRSSTIEIAVDVLWELGYKMNISLEKVVKESPK